MEELKSMDEIKNEIANVGFHKQNEVVVPQKEEKSNADIIVENLHKKAMVDIVKNDKDVQGKIIDQANKSIDDALDTIDAKEKKKNQDANYDANKEACENYGIDASVPKWEVNMMKCGSAIWFIIYFIIASVTICPVKVFCRGINTFIKKEWLVIVVAILMWLFVAFGVPLIIKLVSTIN